MENFVGIIGSPRAVSADVLCRSFFNYLGEVAAGLSPAFDSFTMWDILESSRVEFVALGKILIALGLGALVGFEREAAHKWAGLRTHMLVCAASTVFVLLGMRIEAVWETPSDSPFPRLDPSRIIEAIVTGVAFLGAGTIIFNRTQTAALGLTTAASLLATAPVGIAVALGDYVLATGWAILIFLVLRVVGGVEKRIVPPQKRKSQKLPEEQPRVD